MLYKLDKDQGKKYTFIVKSNWVEKIVSKEKIFSNDVFVKYEANLNNLEGELIICSDIKKLDGFCKKVIRENYSEYLDFITKRDFKKEQWVYNILDGISEQDSILYKDDSIVVVPNYTWVNNTGGADTDLSKMYILTFPFDKKLHSIRDLDGTHIGLLELIKTKTLEIIKLTYGFESDVIKMYLHYAPSTYHLHVHFVLVSNTDANSSCEYSHELNDVIENLKINSNYYKLVSMNKRI
jgi:m7GpppX diphosphatase